METKKEGSETQKYLDLLIAANSMDELKKIYRELARRYHPDMHPLERGKYDSIMAEINTAREAAEARINKPDTNHTKDLAGNFVDESLTLSSKCMKDINNLDRLVEMQKGSFKLNYGISPQEYDFQGIVENPYVGARFLGEFTIESIENVIVIIKKALGAIIECKMENDNKQVIIYNAEILQRYFSYLAYGFYALSKINRNGAVNFGNKSNNQKIREGIENLEKQLKEKREGIENLEDKLEAKEVDLKNYETLFSGDLLVIDGMISEAASIFEENSIRYLIKDLATLFNKVYENNNLRDELMKIVVKQENE